MEPKWTEWNKAVIEKTHGKIDFYRDLYEGNHSDLFSRAKELIEKGEIVDNISDGQTTRTKNVQTPYIVANISKLIPEIPAMLVSRSIGDVSSSVNADDEMTEATAKQIDDPNEEEIEDPQKRIIEQIEKNSNLRFEHWSNIVQQQVDGGLVGVPWDDERGLRIDFKGRDVYFPHEDGLGADLAYHREFGKEEYLHVYRERVEEDGLRTSHYLYHLNSDQTEEIEEDEAKELLGLDELEVFYEGRTRPFIVYWPNEKTFTNPLGKSCLKNQEGKQDEINWTLTRNGITFERNGKPKIAVTPDAFAAAQDKAYERYGEEGVIDHRDFEVITYDQNGRAIELIQIDVSKIGDIQWVKDLMKLMLMETKTSEKAVDFYLDGGSSGAQSGIAKFYDLFISIIKSEQIRDEYIYFLKQLFENCLWLANKDDPAIIIEEPDIALKSMIPISRKELLEENNSAYAAGTQSLETTLKRNNPNASEEWIEEELERIEEEKQGDDTTSLMNGRSNLMNFLDNRDASGDPIQDEGKTEENDPEGNEDDG